MSNLPLTIRKTASRCSRMIDEMQIEYFHEHMPEEEKNVAEESLNAYCEPREFYNMLQRRAIKNPLFLQRSLKYQTEAKQLRRIQMTMFLSATINAGVPTQKLFPLYIMVARLLSCKTTEEYTTALYKFSRVCLLTGFDGDSQEQANFLLPRMDKLASEAKSGPLAILLISFAGAQNSQFDIDSSKNHSGLCLWSNIPMESLYSSWQECPNMDLGQKVNLVYPVERHPCFVQSMSKEKCVLIRSPRNCRTSSSQHQFQVTISAQEVGATENPPYSSSFSFNGIPAFSLVLPINRMRKGQVVFSYRYYNNTLQEHEVTEDFTCPFCKVKCASFKGMECHMLSMHDRFNFEFWINKENPAVEVSIKSETMITEINEDDPNARLEPYALPSKKSSRRKQKTPVRFLGYGALTADADSVKSEKSQIPPGVAESSSQTVPPENVPPTIETMITEFSKIQINEDDPNARLEPYPLPSKKSSRRKLKTPVRFLGYGALTNDADSVKSEKSQTPPGGAESSSQTVPPKNVQTMITEFSKIQINEGDPNARLEPSPLSSKTSRRRKQKTPVRNPRPGPRKTYDADSFKSEKSQMRPEILQIKNMWTSFAKEHRVFEDGRIPWGCYEFSKLHGSFMVRNIYMLGCWKKFMWTQRIYGHLDAQTLNNCTEFLEQLRN